MIQATGDKLIILPDTPMDRTPGGLIIPVDSREKTNSGVVVDGSILEYEECTERLTKWYFISPGDKVAFNYRAGYEVEKDGVVYLSIAKEHILMKL